jgi:hypothetical protein
MAQIPPIAVSNVDLEATEHKILKDTIDLLAPGTLPIPKVHRAWERQPRSPRNKNGNLRKIYRRPEAQLRTISAEQAAQTTPQKHAVKKLCVGGDEKMHRGMEKSGLLMQKQSHVTKWDRRKSALPRKTEQNHPLDSVLIRTCRKAICIY